MTQNTTILTTVTHSKAFKRPKRTLFFRILALLRFPLQQNAVARTSFDRFDLPVQYHGKNIFLAQVLDSFILDNTDTDFTRVILPVELTDQLNIAWNVWKFEETLAGRVPHEGVSRLIRSRREQFNERLVRRGIAMTLEHGFLYSEMGRQQYVQNIVEIKKAVELTMSFDALSTLLMCKRFNIQWEREHGYFEQRLSDIMKREVNQFAIVQKDPNGFDILIEEHKKQMQRYAVSPNALILPSKLQIYIPMVPLEKHLYANRGSLGVKNFEKGPIQQYRGVKIYEGTALRPEQW